jgi:hypothetical protein
MFLNGNKVCGQVSSTWLGGQAVSMHANASHGLEATRRREQTRSQHKAHEVTKKT